MKGRKTKYEKQMPLEVVYKIASLIHLRLVSEIKITENHGFWDVEVIER